MPRSEKQKELRTERLLLILQWRADGLTFVEIGDRLGVTKARVWQMHRDARQAGLST